MNEWIAVSSMRENKLFGNNKRVTKGGAEGRNYGYERKERNIKKTNLHPLNDHCPFGEWVSTTQESGELSDDGCVVLLLASWGGGNVEREGGGGEGVDGGVSRA
jgi:hypothetical protein